MNNTKTIKVIDESGEHFVEAYKCKNSLLVFMFGGIEFRFQEDIHTVDLRANPKKWRKPIIEAP